MKSDITRIINIKYNAADVIAPANAPLPADAAFKGLRPLLTRYKTKPTTGKKKPRATNPALGASATLVLAIGAHEQPHPGQTTA